MVTEGVTFPNPEVSRRFVGDVRYFNDHEAELLKEHPDCWVALFDRKVAAFGPDLDNVLLQLSQLGITPVEGPVIRYLSTKPNLWIL
ncbi:MAG: hypothetical protein OXL97_06360 [Chloroflexota bacterium]|nr:hypothetical protein [Chloroflexota bacterium]MDE2884881.1 hypothetical protein [Chloroflexota bacterium]